ncbi:MAG: hypothetical protein PHE74_01410 [Comamonas sp.]|jgi:hypothetical protein|nr:hypothetical protein [Comamonas sp.]
MSGHFEAQHAHIEALLTDHLLEVVGGDFAQAQRLFVQWHGALQTHIHIENTALLPHVPTSARWAATVYLREHERIALLAEEYAQRLQLVLNHPPRDALAQRRASLYLLDAIHALRHVIEHHHERENTALAHELPLELQQQVWAQVPLDT